MSNKESMMDSDYGIKICDNLLKQFNLNYGL